jgi:hypothetical protein
MHCLVWNGECKGFVELTPKMPETKSTIHLEG